MNAAAVLTALTNNAAVAASRAATLPLGTERTALEAAGMYWGQLGAALERGAVISTERFAAEVAKADANNAEAGQYGIPAQAAALVAAYAA